jgi:beta-galactosidase
MSLTAPSRARLDLAGSWQLAFDPDLIGLRDGWVSGCWPEAQSHTELVPSIWNVKHPAAEGIGFYRKLFALPAGWSGRVVRLHFGGASYAATVWLNGCYIGAHEGAYDPFTFDVTALCRPDADNELVVRVAGLAKNVAVDGLPLLQVPASKHSWYYTYGGLWGEVYLEAAALLWCESLHVEPDLRGEMALVTVGVHNSHQNSRPVDLELQITGPDGASAYAARSVISAPVGHAHFTYRIHLPRPSAWTCETPQLYQLRVSLQADEVDSAITQFGMRDFSVRDGQFFLNGEPIYLRGVLLQPNYPVQLVVPPEPAMMEQEIRLAKDAGFNMIRVHIRPAPPGYLDLTDRLGMLVYAESGLAWIKDSPRLPEHGRREVQTLIERDRNHPSVVIRGIYNENRQANAINGEALMQWARTLDPTRVIVDNSGGSFVIDQDFSWIDRAHVLAERETSPQKIQDVHIYLGAPIAAEVYDWMRTLGVPDTGINMPAHDFGSVAVMEEWNRELRAYRGKLLVSELGVGGMADLDGIVAGYGDQVDLKDARDMIAYRDSLHQGFAQRRLDRLFGSVGGLVQATQALQAAGNTRQFEALLCNPRVSGYVLTQLNDVAGEFHAGLVDHWRRPKQAYYAAREVHQPHRLVLKAARSVAACGESVAVSLTVLSRHALPDGAQVHVTISGPPDGQASSLTMAAPAGAGIKPLGAIAVELGTSPGEYRVAARLDIGSEIVTQSSEVILALPAVDWSEFSDPIQWFGRVPAVPQLPSSGAAPTLAVAPDPASLTTGDWESLLATVHAGRAAVIGPLHPRDAPALRTLAAHHVAVQLHYAIGSWMGCYHWIPQSELFDGLPAGGLAGEAYVDVLPWYGMSELGGEVYAGSLRNTQTREAPPAMLWYSEIEAIPFGRGRLFFCQYRIFAAMDKNPLAATLAHNLISLANRFENVGG